MSEATIIDMLANQGLAVALVAWFVWRDSTVGRRQTELLAQIEVHLRPKVEVNGGD